MMVNKKILVVAAHPDDEVLGCGGTIARLAKEGNPVYIAILGEGITSRYAERDQAEAAELGALQEKCRKAADMLGAAELFTYDLPDNRFDTVPLLDIVKLVEELISKISPEVLFTHHGADLNIDHVLTHRAALTATRPVKGQPVREVYAFEAPSSTEWSFQRFERGFAPNYFVDVSGTLELKIKALEYYDSETRSFPHPRSPEALRAIARRWGSVSGCDAAEAFELVRAVK